MPGLLPVADARRLILAGLAPLDVETVPLSQSLGRVLRQDGVAKVSHPPVDVSAMDGYAVRAADVGKADVRVNVIGESAAGHMFGGEVGAGEAVRIFTGAAMPAGADAVVIQEDTTRDGNIVTVLEASSPGRHVRRAGQDFRAGEMVLPTSRRLTARDVGLLGAMNFAHVQVSRRPRVGVLSTGDEIVMPGETAGPGQIVSANGPGLCALIRAAGGEDIHLGVVRDEMTALRTALTRAEPLDLLVTSGGVSVGDHDLMGKVMSEQGEGLAFHKVAMRPGKPLLFGRINGLPLLGLPGNPVSAMICAILFLRPAVDRLMGLPGEAPRRLTVRLGAEMKANDGREDYIRATLTAAADGALVATPFPKQDSGMMSALAKADALIIRPPQAPAAGVGSAVSVIPLDFDR